MNKKQVMQTTYHCENLTELIDTLTFIKSKNTNYTLEIKTDKVTLGFPMGKKLFLNTYDMILEEEVNEDDN